MDLLTIGTIVICSVEIGRCISTSDCRETVHDLVDMMDNMVKGIEAQAHENAKLQRKLIDAGLYEEGE